VLRITLAALLFLKQKSYFRHRRMSCLGVVYVYGTEYLPILQAQRLELLGLVYSSTESVDVRHDDYQVDKRQEL
jgi:hypothetical protein